MEIVSLIIKLKENVLGNKISKVTACLWLFKNYQVQDEMKIMARGDILVKITNKNDFDDLKTHHFIYKYPIEVPSSKSLNQFKKVDTLYENINLEEIEWKNKSGM